MDYTIIAAAGLVVLVAAAAALALTSARGLGREIARLNRVDDL